MLIPAYGCFVEIDEDLFRFEIFFEAPGTEFAAEAGLFVAAPRGFDVGRLHVIDPDDAGAERFYDAKGFIDVARPDGGCKSVWRVVGDANRVGFAVEGNHRRDRTKDFFAGDARGVIHVVENRGLDVIALAELLRAPPADGDLRFFLAYFQVRADAIILFFADERSHFRFPFARRA